jgi:hypothetical protein
VFRYAEGGALLGWSKTGALWWPTYEFDEKLDDAAAVFAAHGADHDIWIGCGLRANPHPNGARGTDRDVIGVPGLWADIDAPPEDVVLTLKELELPPSLLVGSGHGVHAWWLLDEFWMFTGDDDRVEARTLLRRLHTFVRAHGWKVDAVHDLARVMRAPGTLNHKTDPPKRVEILDDARSRRYALSDLDDWLPEGEPAPLPGNHPPPPDLDDVELRELDGLADEWATRDARFARTWARTRDDLGSSSEYDLAVCTKAVDMGCDDGTAWALVRRWRHRHGEDPGKAERADYAARTLARARAGAPPQTYPGPAEPAAERAAARVATRVVDRLRARLHIGSAVCALPPLTPLVDGVLFLPGESVVFSPPKTGKTAFALDLALSVGTGADFMGRSVKQAKVLYVTAEGVGGLGARVAAWCEHHGAGDIGGVAFLTTAVNLLDADDLAAVCAIGVELGVALVIIDTLARCLPGADENSAKDMGRAVAALDRIRDCTGHVVAVHHAGKDVAKGMRGSSALLGAVDTVVELSGDPLALRVAVTDQKDAEPAPPWWCRLVAVGDSVVVELVGTADVSSASQRTVLEALTALPAEDRTSSKWQEMAAELGVSRTVFFEAKKKLLDRAVVVGGGARGALYRPAEEAK